MILRDKNTPEESKILLTKHFVSGDIKRDNIKTALNCCVYLNKPLRVLAQEIRNRTTSLQAIDSVVFAFESLYDALLLVQEYPEIGDGIIFIERVIKQFREKPSSSEAISFPSIGALYELDESYQEKDPAEFKKLKELRGSLTDLLNSKS